MARALGLGMLVIVALSLSGCESFNSTSGSVAGFSLSPRDVMFLNLAYGGSTPALELFVSNTANLCRDFKDNRQPKNSTFMVLTLVEYEVPAQGAATAKTPTAGEFRIAPGGVATQSGRYMTGRFDSLNSNCGSLVASTAGTLTAGSLTVKSFDASAGGLLKGSFDLSFGSDRITGQLNATWCDAPSLPSTPQCY